MFTYHEAAVLAYLDGRAGAPKLFSTCVSRGVIVMEYIDGVTVEDLIISLRLNHNQWLQVLVSIAERLKELHSAGIVHADFKVDNCMITFDGSGNPDAHIIDFGISGKAGQPSILGRKQLADWEKTIEEKPWYAAETFLG